MQKCYAIGSRRLLTREAEGVRFELTRPFGLPVFKTGAINRSATPPGKVRSRELCHRSSFEQGGLGGSSSPLLDVTRWQRSRIYFGIARGAAGSTKDSSTS